MDERMTWEEIVKKYPDQWVGLVDVDWKDGANVRSAVVKYTDLSRDELLELQVGGEEGELYSTYTTPDNVFQLGMVGW